MPESNEPGLGFYLGVGLELAVGVTLGYVVGHWLDKRFGWDPWGVVVGAGIGFAGGMYLLIKAAIRANKD